MPKLIIDDREIEVPKGTKVIDAAEKLGIVIPRFCYHPALGSVGACRVCAVKFLEGRVKGIQMSCMIDAEDGMVVSTVDEEAVAFRKRVIELLMLNHPHDCPVCDEGGHCLLQDLTVSGGHGLRFYKGNKKTHIDQDLGPLVQHEMNRCIKCYRCSRFYQEYCGYYDLGVMQISSRVYYGRFRDGVLESPFAGNLSDVCPTGVYTDKPARYKGRRWDFERTPSVCIHCGLGCLTTASARYRAVVRQEAAFSETTNGSFICDRGRFGFYYASDSDRPRQAGIDGRQASVEAALESAKTKIDEIVKRHGRKAVAWVGSPRNSLETMAALYQAGRGNSGTFVSLFPSERASKNAKAAVSRLNKKLGVSLKEIESADFILAVGADPVNEAPMLALAMRQAWRKGAFVAAIDPRPVSLPFEFQHLAVPQPALASATARLVKPLSAAKANEKLTELCSAIIDKGKDCPDFETALSEIRERLEKANRPVIVCGADIVDVCAINLAADAAELLSADKDAGLFYTLTGPNSFAAGLIEDEEASFETILAGIEGEEIKALILTETDPFVSFHDRKRLVSALEKLELLVAIDYLDSEAAKKANIFLPSETVFESGGVFVNQEGRARYFMPALKKGISIEQAGRGSHPPRVFDARPAGADLLPAWRMVSILGGAGEQVSKKGALEIVGSLRDKAPGLAGLPAGNAMLREGHTVLSMPGETAAQGAGDNPESLEDVPPGNRICVLTVENTFGTEELSSLSRCLQGLAKKASAVMHPETMESLGLAEGDRIAIGPEENAAVAPVVADKRTAPGTIVLPRLTGFQWRVFERSPAFVEKKAIRKVN